VAKHDFLPPPPKEGTMRHPDVPESLDSWHILHRMFRFKRRAFDALDAPHRMAPEGDVSVAQLLGHKGDLMLTHYAKNFDELGAAQTAFDKLALADYVEPLTSYVSILELGLYEATGKIHADLRERGLKTHGPEWNDAFDAALVEQANQPRNAARLWATIPAINWYQLPYADRARLMVDHGKIGRSFHGLVTQVISGSIGFDDWEWGVDLYADDPLVFKKLIYEMRFDEASARYAAFGQFYTGMQFSISQLPRFLEGDGVPELHVAQAQLAAR
jgi:peroxiredoxin